MRARISYFWRIDKSAHLEERARYNHCLVKKRPIAVTLLSLLLIVMGTIGLVYHLREFRSFHPFPLELLLVSILRILAIVSGAYMLRGANWARWLAVPCRKLFSGRPMPELRMPAAKTAPQDLFQVIQ